MNIRFYIPIRHSTSSADHDNPFMKVNTGWGGTISTVMLLGMQFSQLVASTPDAHHTTPRLSGDEPQTTVFKKTRDQFSFTLHQTN